MPACSENPPARAVGVAQVRAHHRRQRAARRVLDESRKFYAVQFHPVMKIFAQNLGVKVIRVDAEQRFLDALLGEADPERKHKIIGAEFVKVFEMVLTSCIRESWKSLFAPRKYRVFFEKLVGVKGFEPSTPTPRCLRLKSAQSFHPKIDGT